VLSNLDVLGTAKGIIIGAGCGDGRHIFEIAEKGWNIIGIDYSDTVLNELNKKITERKLSFQCRLIQADSHESVLPKDSCNGGICVDVLSIVDFPEKVLKNLHFYAMKGSIFLITLQNTLDETCGQGQLISNNSQESFKYLLNNITYRFFTKKGVLNLIEKNDWQILDIKEYARKDPPHEHRPLAHEHVYFGRIIKAK
jgi:ubiquinone/menaquinone biosynthesis C-methylase UbiE